MMCDRAITRHVFLHKIMCLCSANYNSLKFIVKKIVENEFVQLKFFSLDKKILMKISMFPKKISLCRANYGK